MRSRRPSLPKPIRPWKNIKKDFTPDQVKQAQKALLLGDTVNAEALFQKALDKSASKLRRPLTNWGFLQKATSIT